MESRAKLFGHSIHQMLVVFPLGLLTTAVIFDTISLINPNVNLHVIAFWMIVSGIIGGLIASIFGFIDWLAIPTKTRAKSIGAIHAYGNVWVMILFGASALWRRSDPSNPEMLALVFSYIGILLATVTAWLGGELLTRLGVGIDDGAHLNARNSLKGPVGTTSSP